MGIIVHINELGPIRNSDVTLKPLMVFTGDSGLGKSYTAFLFYHFITSISSERLIDFVRRKWQDIDSKKNLSDIRLKLKDIRMWINNGTSSYMGYLLGNNGFKCSVNYIFDVEDSTDIVINIVNHKDISTVTVNNSVLSIFPDSVNINRSLFVAIALSRYLCQTLLGHNVLTPILFPPARAAFMGGNDMSSSVGMYRELLNQLSILKTPRQNPDRDDQFFTSMIKRLAEGDIIINNGEISLKIQDGNIIPISAAASSVKELAPFMLLLENGRQLRNYSVLFEEPEAHVHPKKQYIVMDIMARCLNKGMLIQMTTHSDYLLSRLNQLIRLGAIRKKSEKVFNDFCNNQKHNRNLYIDSSMVGAYFFKRDNGTVEIISQEASNGINFSSFNEIVNGQLNLNAIIDEYGEKAGLTFDV